MPRRPRILLLARSFPPTENIASVRTKNIAKHLSRLGWHVTVVTVDPRLLVDPGDEAGTRQLLACEGIERITTRHRLGNLVPGFVRVGLLGSLRPVAGLTRLLGRWLDVDSGYGWIRPVLKSCRRLQPGDVDVIVASGPPYASFVAAEVLAKRLQCPFALDYRDPWTQSSYRWNRPRARSFRAERRLVAGCSLITTVSPNLAEGFKQVEDGREDATAAFPFQFNQVQKELNLNLKLTGTVWKGDIFFILNKNATVLKAKIDEAIKALKKDGTLAALSNKWLGEDTFKD